MSLAGASLKFCPLNKPAPATRANETVTELYLTYLLTVFFSNRGKNPAKYGVKAGPPTAEAKEGRMSPAYSINMASYSACWSESSTSSSSPC